MYCLQWLIPVLLIPKPLNPALVQTHVMFMVLYLIGFFLERKPCTLCSLVFLAAVFLICYSGVGNCLFWSSVCENEKGQNFNIDEQERLTLHCAVCGGVHLNTIVQWISIKVFHKKFTSFTVTEMFIMHCNICRCSFLKKSQFNIKVLFCR